MSAKLPKNLSFLKESDTNNNKPKAYGLFNRNNSNRDLEAASSSSSLNTQNEPSEKSGLLGSISNTLTIGVKAQVLKSISNRTKNALQGAQEQYTNSMNFTKNLPYIIGLVIAGLLLIFLSTLYLPLLVLVPQKFSSLFALGSICLLSAIAMVRGPQTFLKSLLKSDKIIYSLWYLLSLIGTFYFSIFAKSYIFAMVFAISQIVSLAWLIGSSIPGGVTVIKHLQNIIIKCCKTCFTMIYKSSNFSSV